MKKALAGLFVALMSVTAAYAEFTPPAYSTAIDTVKTDLAAVITSAGLPAIGCLVLMLGFGLVWRLVKRAAKSV